MNNFNQFEINNQTANQVIGGASARTRSIRRMRKIRRERALAAQLAEAARQEEVMAGADVAEELIQDEAGTSDFWA